MIEARILLPRVTIDNKNALWLSTLCDRNKIG
jgi:hypothetical protein